MINELLKVENAFMGINAKRQEQLRILVEKKAIEEAIKDAVIVERIKKKRL